MSKDRGKAVVNGFICGYLAATGTKVDKIKKFQCPSYKENGQNPDSGSKNSENQNTLPHRAQAMWKIRPEK